MKKSQFLLLFLLLAAKYVSWAQQPDTLKPAVIYLRNPSFENDILSRSARNVFVKEWQDCGFKNCTPPEVQPGSFGVMNPPSEGKTYISMVTREDGTYEGLSQELARPLQQKTIYLWRIDLCSSDEMYSPTTTSKGIYVSYNASAKLYVWGGNNICDKAELLDSTNWVDHTNWLQYTLVLSPQKSNYTHITFDVCTGMDTTPKVCSNILVDNASPLFPIEWNTSDSLLTVTFLQNWFNPRLLSESWEEPVTSGAMYLLDGLAFSKNDTGIKSSSKVSLNALLEKLIRFPDLTVEIGAHSASNVDNANAVSAHRAQLVANWLMEKGIEASRITHKGYGQSMLRLYDEEYRGAEERNCVVVRVW
jgi:outer membrane protein OmpA-like peptidoglycan-associated protein